MESVFPSAYLTVVSFCARILTVLNTGDVNVMKRKILIVDDEQSIADLVEVYLSNEGISILENVGTLGVPLPEKVQSLLRHLKNTGGNAPS